MFSGGWLREHALNFRRKTGWTGSSVLCPFGREFRLRVCRKTGRKSGRPRPTPGFVRIGDWCRRTDRERQTLAANCVAHGPLQPDVAWLHCITDGFPSTTTTRPASLCAALLHGQCVSPAATDLLQGFSIKEVRTKSTKNRLPSLVSFCPPAPYPPGPLSDVGCNCIRLGI